MAGPGYSQVVCRAKLSAAHFRVTYEPKSSCDDNVVSYATRQHNADGDT
jgi:hypothetical protein